MTPNLNEMRTVTDRLEMEKLFAMLLAEEKSLFIWQPQDYLRIKANGYIRKIDEHRNIIEVSPISSNQFDFKSNLPIYFYSHHRQMILKANLLFNSKNTLAFSYPEELKSVETRTEERVIENDFIHFTPITEKYLSPSPRKRRLLDQSSMGLAFEISLSEEKKYYEGDRLKLSLPEHEEARIVYINALYDRSGNKKSHRVGVKFH